MTTIAKIAMKDSSLLGYQAVPSISSYRRFERSLGICLTLLDPEVEGFTILLNGGNLTHSTTLFHVRGGLTHAVDR